jgi:hypothetical protein
VWLLWRGLSREGHSAEPSCDSSSHCCCVGVQTVLRANLCVGVCVECKSIRSLKTPSPPALCRDLPRLIDIVQGSSSSSSSDTSSSTIDSTGAVRRKGGRSAAINVQLSADETYADIVPVRQPDATSAFVSIMRGCNNSESLDNGCSSQLSCWHDEGPAICCCCCCCCCRWQLLVPVRMPSHVVVAFACGCCQLPAGLPAARVAEALETSDFVFKLSDSKTARWWGCMLDTHLYNPLLCCLAVPPHLPQCAPSASCPIPAAGSAAALWTRS